MKWPTIPGRGRRFLLVGGFGVLSALALLLVAWQTVLRTSADPDLGTGELTVFVQNTNTVVKTQPPNHYDVAPGSSYDLQICGITEVPNGAKLFIHVNGQDQPGVVFKDKVSVSPISGGCVTFKYTVHSTQCETTTIHYNATQPTVQFYVAIFPGSSPPKPAHLRAVDSNNVPIPCQATTPTNTPVTPTVTNTPVTPTATRTVGITPQGSTDTPTKTNTPVTPTRTNTPTATHTPQGPKPPCSVVPDLAFPDPGCDQFQGNLSFQVNHPQLGTSNCSTDGGDISLARSQVVAQGSLHSFTFNVFFGKIIGTCPPPLGGAFTIHVNPTTSVGSCKSKTGDILGLYNCTGTMSVQIETTNFGKVTVDIPLTCHNVQPGALLNNCTGGPLALPGTGLTIKVFTIELKITPTPTPTRTPRPPVGGIFRNPAVGAAPLEAQPSSSSHVWLLTAVAAIAVASAITLGGGAWYARRRKSVR